MTDPPLEVIVVNEQRLPIDEYRIAEVARVTAKAEGAIGEVSINLVTTGRIAELNEEHLNEVGPTDVLSFPVDGLKVATLKDAAPPLIGQIVICPAVAAAQSGNDLAGELDLLVAHGVLHLLGFDHETEDQAEQMRKREMAATGRAGASSS